MVIKTKSSVITGLPDISQQTYSFPGKVEIFFSLPLLVMSMAKNYLEIDLVIKACLHLLLLGTIARWKLGDVSFSSKISPLKQSTQSTRDPSGS